MRTNAFHLEGRVGNRVIPADDDHAVAPRQDIPHAGGNLIDRLFTDDRRQTDREKTEPAMECRVTLIVEVGLLPK